jgi:hypothetical protein
VYTFAVPLDRALATAAGSCAVVCQHTGRTYAEVADPLPKSAASKILKRQLREPHWAGQRTYVSGS